MLCISDVEPGVHKSSYFHYPQKQNIGLFHSESGSFHHSLSFTFDSGQRFSFFKWQTNLGLPLKSVQVFAIVFNRKRNRPFIITDDVYQECPSYAHEKFQLLAGRTNLYQNEKVILLQVCGVLFLMCTMLTV